MASRRKSEGPERKRRPPATTPEGRENQLVSMSFDLAQKQLEEGTASAQVITHFLKLGSIREGLEREKIRRENILLESKADAIEASKRVEELYSNALNAMRSYTGEVVEDEDAY